MELQINTFKANNLCKGLFGTTCLIEAFPVCLYSNLPTCIILKVDWSADSTVVDLGCTVLYSESRNNWTKWIILRQLSIGENDKHIVVRMRRETETPLNILLDFNFWLFVAIIVLLWRLEPSPTKITSSISLFTGDAEDDVNNVFMF